MWPSHFSVRRVIVDFALSNLKGYCASVFYSLLFYYSCCSDSNFTTCKPMCAIAMWTKLSVQRHWRCSVLLLLGELCGCSTKLPT